MLCCGSFHLNFFFHKKIMFSNYFKVGIKLIGSNLGSRCDFPILFSSANRYVIFPCNFECIQVNWRVEITSPQQLVSVGHRKLCCNGFFKGHFAFVEMLILYFKCSVRVLSMT